MLNGSITITATGGAALPQYSIDGVLFCASSIFRTVLPGTYTVTVKDANGCLTVKQVVVANTDGATNTNSHYCSCRL